MALLQREKKTQDWYTYLRSQWQKREGWSSTNLEAQWVNLLQKGFSTRLAKDEQEAHRPPRPFRTQALEELLHLSPGSGNHPSHASNKEELILYPTSHIQDGSLANVAWLQELPDNITKIC